MVASMHLAILGLEMAAGTDAKTLGSPEGGKEGDDVPSSL